MSPFTEARMHLGVDLRFAAPGTDTAMVRIAARRGLDFAALAGRDAIATATTLAPLISGIGLIPQLFVDPVPVAPADLTAVSGGRAGWEPTGGSWAAIGAALATLHAHTGPDAPVLVLRADADDALPVVGAWADVVRVAAPDLDSALAAAVRAREAVAAAGRDPDDVVVLLDVEVRLADDRVTAARSVQTAPSSLRVAGPPQDLARLVGSVVRRGVADGISLLPLDPETDLPRIAADLVPLLAGRGLFRPGRSGTLRTRFGLARERVAVAS